MTDIWAIVPAKAFGLAKQRLADALPPPLRRQLAQAMLEDVLDTLGRVRLLAGVAVVTSSSEVAEVALRHGVSVFDEPAGGGLNSAVADAARRLGADKRSGMLVVAGDVPGIVSGEVDSLIATHRPGAAVSLVPAHDLDGTNAILATPPDILAPAFGPGSFVRHLGAARANDIEPTVMTMPGIGLDIDTPRDIEVFMRIDSDTRTRQVLHRHYQCLWDRCDRIAVGALHHAF